jgi:hypothetical protein
MPRRPAIGLVALVCALACWTSCAPGKGSIMLSVSTDMQVPKDIDVL